MAGAIPLVTVPARRGRDGRGRLRSSRRWRSRSRASPHCPGKPAARPRSLSATRIPAATQVYLAGDFNGWSDSADLMENADGVWTKTLELAPGDYAYKFRGRRQLDPGSRQHSNGDGRRLRRPETPWCTLAAGKDKIDAATAGGGAAGGAAAMAAEGDGELRSVEFRYTPVISGVTNVFLAGTFNDWNSIPRPA